MANGDTTILVKSETRDALKALKVHENQSYDEVIRQLLENYKEVSDGDDDVASESRTKQGD